MARVGEEEIEEMPHDFDAIVVGSGAGGGPVAWCLAQAGKKVAIIEAGGFYTTNDFNRFELLQLRRLWEKIRWTSNFELGLQKEIALGMAAASAARPPSSPQLLTGLLTTISRNGTRPQRYQTRAGSRSAPKISSLTTRKLRGTPAFEDTLSGTKGSKR